MNGGRTTESWGACCESGINDLTALEEPMGLTHPFYSWGNSWEKGRRVA